MIRYSVSFRIKDRRKGNLIDMNSNTLTNLGDSLCWLNNQYRRNHDELYDQDTVFEWEIVSSENHFAGKLLLQNKSFLEEILRIDLSEFQK
jgi:hypothetical protein